MLTATANNAPSFPTQYAVCKDQYIETTKNLKCLEVRQYWQFILGSKVQMLTLNLHMFLDIQEHNVFYENKSCLKLAVEVWSQFVGKVDEFGLGLL